MSSAKSSTSSSESRDDVREKWLERLTQLMGQVEQWAKELDWSTRRIEKRMEDSQLGKYLAPALLMQEGTLRLLLDPIARSAPGAEGIVDLYLMPAYDDIASLYFHNSEWHVHYVFSEDPSVAPVRNIESQPLSKEAFHTVLEAIRQHAA